MKIVSAYNKSDFSFGWNGFNNALIWVEIQNHIRISLILGIRLLQSTQLQLFTDQTVRGSLFTIIFMQLNRQMSSYLTQLQTLFYTHQDEKYVSKDHSYPLVGGLSPTVSFTLVQTKYLGLPFTGW